MSAFGPTTAVVSVGLSCQTAHQIRTHEKLLRKLLGEPVQEKSAPFDWLIVPPAAAARMIADDDYFPTDPTELRQVKVERDGTRPYWARRDCYFWHDEPHKRFQDFLGKAAHTRETFASIAARPRKLFLLSNTQNNLGKSPPGLDLEFTDEAVAVLQGVLQDRFGEHELHVVTHAGRHALSGRVGAVHVLHPDPSRWQGDDAQWKSLFRRILARP